MPPARLAAISLALFVAASCARELDPPAGDIASNLAWTRTLDGASFDPVVLAGKPAIIMFWRVGCSYCMKEMPVVARVAHDRKIPALAILVAGSQDKARQIAAGFDGTVLVDDGTLRQAYDITKVPYTLVLRPDGTAARAFLGEQSESTLGSALDAISPK